MAVRLRCNLVRDGEIEAELCTAEPGMWAYHCDVYENRGVVRHGGETLGFLASQFRDL
jgi:hypothetical protein